MIVLRQISPGAQILVQSVVSFDASGPATIPPASQMGIE